MSEERGLETGIRLAITMRIAQPFLTPPWYSLEFSFSLQFRNLLDVSTNKFSSSYFGAYGSMAKGPSLNYVTLQRDFIFK